jgi:hypothetical protein
VLLAQELVARAGIEPSLTGLKDRAPLQKRNAREMVGAGRIELPALGLSCRCSANELRAPYPETESNRRMLGVGQPLYR